MLLLFALGLATFAQPTSVKCGNSAVAQTPAVKGPNSTSAVLKVFSQDDHAKDAHLCMADYRLEIADRSAKSRTVDLMSSDDDWERKISIELAGFTEDGTKIVGMFSEEGAHPTQQVFEYSPADGSMQMFDLRQLSAAFKPEKCLVNAQILGTLKNGEIVIQLRSGNNCRRSSEWLLNSLNGPMERLLKHAKVQAFYGAPQAW